MKLTTPQLSLIIFVAINTFLFLMLNYYVELSVTLWLTSQEYQKDLANFENIEKINSLLINTDVFKTISEKNAQAYNLLPILSGLVVAIIAIMLIILRWAIHDSTDIINSIIPKWKITEHSKIMIPVTIGIFVAISLSYFSSLAIISILRVQTIINNIALSLDAKQPEVINNLLVGYIQSNLSEYFSAMSGFLYFLFALIFPILGTALYYREKKINYWILTLFTTSALIIPYWIIR